MKQQCPGQDPRFWKPSDVHIVACPKCGNEVEFFKDDPSRKCPSCGARFKNPHLDLGCAEWCPHTKECLDYIKRETGEEAEESAAG